MIVESYYVHVYCDAPMHPRVIGAYTPEPTLFRGDDKQSAHRKRRAAGWRKLRGRDYCPECMPMIARERKRATAMSLETERARQFVEEAHD